MRDSYHLIEISLTKENYEAGFSILDDENCIGMEEEGIDPVRLKAFFQNTEPLTSLVERLKKKLGSSSVHDGKNFVLDPSVFKAGFFDPFEFVDGIWIVPPPDLGGHPLPSPRNSASGAPGAVSSANGLPSREREIEVMIRPGMGFGTGRDDTTRLAAENYCTLHYKIPPAPLFQRGEEKVLDVGTGSGILAITAFKLGAKKVDAVEIDPDALDNARENLVLNGIKEIHLYKDINEVHGTYDVLIANIITPTILELAPHLEKKLKAHGFLILSGILHHEKDQILNRFRRFQLMNSLSSQEWVSLLFKCTF